MPDAMLLPPICHSLRANDLAMHTKLSKYVLLVCLARLVLAYGRYLVNHTREIRPPDLHICSSDSVPVSQVHSASEQCGGHHILPGNLATVKGDRCHLGMQTNYHSKGQIAWQATSLSTKLNGGQYFFHYYSCFTTSTSRSWPSPCGPGYWPIEQTNVGSFDRMWLCKVGFNVEVKDTAGSVDGFSATGFVHTVGNFSWKSKRMANEARGTVLFKVGRSKRAGAGFSRMPFLCFTALTCAFSKIPHRGLAGQKYCVGEWSRRNQTITRSLVPLQNALIIHPHRSPSPSQAPFLSSPHYLLTTLYPHHSHP